jgi:peptide/nickel transport system substrate-binding protein
MRIRAAVTGALVVGLTLVGCTSSPTSPPSTSSSSGGAAAPVKVTFLSSAPQQGFDPNIAATNASVEPMSWMYETLIEENPQGQWVPDLAQSWTVSPDGLTYTFKLRPNNAFSDGSKVTAQDVVFTFNRLKTGKSQQFLAQTLKSVTAVDSLTVKFTLNKANRAFLNIIGTGGTSGILSQKAVEANPKYFSMPTATSGPWYLASYIPDSQMEFKANPHFYDPPQITDIVVPFTTDPTSDAAAVESGSADMAAIDYSQVASLKDNPSVQVVEEPGLAPTFFAWDTTKPPFNDVRVRQAVAYADDRNSIRKDCWFGTGLASYGSILIPGSEYYVPINTYKDAGSAADDAKAEQLLDAAGWKMEGGQYRVAEGVPGVKNGTPFTVTVPYESDWAAAACHTELLQSDLAKIGIEVTPQSYDYTSFYTVAGQGKFEMYHGGDVALNTIDLFVNWFHSGGTATAITTHLNDPTIDAEIDKAVSTPDDTEAATLFKQLEEYEATQLPILVDGFQYSQMLLTTRIKNYVPVPGAINDYTMRHASVSS